MNNIKNNLHNKLVKRLKERKPVSSRTVKNVEVFLRYGLSYLIAKKFKKPILTLPIAYGLKKLEESTLKKLEIKRHYIRNNSLFTDTKVLHISDIHGEDTKELIDLIKKEQPDLVIITGDDIDEITYKEKYENIKNLYKYLKQNRIEVVRVEGNHEPLSDYYENFKEFLDILEVETLNQSNFYYGGLKITDIISEQADILIMHNPDDIVGKEYIVLAETVLAGHTHGGQINIPYGDELRGIVLNLNFKYKKGINKINNKSTLYVSNGYGTATPRIRISAQRDVQIFYYYLSR